MTVRPGNLDLGRQTALAHDPQPCSGVASLPPATAYSACVLNRAIIALQEGEALLCRRCRSRGKLEGKQEREKSAPDSRPAECEIRIISHSASRRASWPSTPTTHSLQRAHSTHDVRTQGVSMRCCATAMVSLGEIRVRSADAIRQTATQLPHPHRQASLALPRCRRRRIRRCQRHAVFCHLHQGG